MSEDQLLYLIPVVFPIFFALVWIGVTSLLSVLSGWFTLMQQFPNRDEKPLLQLNWQSGFMGTLPVNYRNVLKLGVCPSGLRIGVLRPFGLFAHDFFVPWHALKAERKEYWMWQAVELSLGKPPIGRLMIYGSTADRIAEAAKGWPEITNVFKNTKR